MYYGTFMLFDDLGKLEKGERVYIRDLSALQ
jgi:sortase (surface protein transpeptidase)